MNQLKKVGEVKAVSSSEIANSRIGIGFEKLDRAVFDPSKAYDKVAALGVKWVRIQSGWARTELQKGVYSFEWLDEIVDNLRKRGLIPWMCLCYGNGLYDEDAAKWFGAVGCPPVKTEEQKRAWHAYVSTLTARYQGRVGWYEVWNEPDGSWCWKHGTSGSEYGEFVKATAAAVKAGDPGAKIIGGSICMGRLEWLNQVFLTGAAEVMDAMTYHGYMSDESLSAYRLKAIRALAHQYRPSMEIIQGETGAQSRDDGAGALHGAAWTPERQARFLVRHTMSHLLESVKFTSYFSCMDMVEALSGTVGNKSSYMDFGYFGVLGANFDENGVATGNYTPKLSYRALQTIAAIFHDDFEVAELPIRFFDSEHSVRILRNDDSYRELYSGGFRRPDGSCAFVYWKPVELLTTSYESSVSLEVAALPEKIQVIRLMTGEIFEVPSAQLTDKGNGYRHLLHLPLYDDPVLVTFGDFIPKH